MRNAEEGADQAVGADRAVAVLLVAGQPLLVVRPRELLVAAAVLALVVLAELTAAIVAYPLIARIKAGGGMVFCVPTRGAFLVDKSSAIASRGTYSFTRVSNAGIMGNSTQD